MNTGEFYQVKYVIGGKIMKWQNVKLGKRAAIVCATFIVASGTVLPGLTVSASDGSVSSGW